MKRALLLSPFILCNLLWGQSPYRPFPEADAGWGEEVSWLQPLTNCGDYSWVSCSRPVYFDGDTVINGTTYHRLLSNGLCYWQLTGMPFPLPPWCSWSGSYAEPQGLFALIRQDTTARRVYLYDMQDEQEKLLYDFTIGLGPYPDTYNNVMPGMLQVVALDSMELNDGWHRTWVLGVEWQGNLTDSAFCTIIEGVGSTYGLLYALAPPFESGSMLYCHNRAGDTVYPLGELACALNVGTAEAPPTMEPIRAWPNPVHDVLHFDRPVAGHVLDPQGRVVLEVPMGSTLDVRALPPGLYGLRTAQDGLLRFVRE
jgi:hypothetical protein